MFLFPLTSFKFFSVYFSAVLQFEYDKPGLCICVFWYLPLLFFLLPGYVIWWLTFIGKFLAIIVSNVPFLFCISTLYGFQLLRMLHLLKLSPYFWMFCSVLLCFPFLFSLCFLVWGSFDIFSSSSILFSTMVSPFFFF